MKVLQQDPARTIVLEDGGVTVRKTFHGEEHAVQADLAAREFERMSRFCEALGDMRSATCPSPIELGAGAAPYVRMERASGVPMQDYLAGDVLPAARLDELAAVLQRAVIRYVETFDEPYWDFILRNMFYDEEQGVVTFLDFGVPTIYLPALEVLERHAPLEVSVGGLLASSVFEAARPKRMVRRREHRQAYALARLVLDRLLGEPGAPAVTAAGVRSVARTTYGIAAGGGSRERQLWYRWCGALIARPDRKLDLVGRADPRLSGFSS